MQIAHGALVPAALDKAHGEARDAAGVGGDAGVVGAQAQNEVQDGACVDGVKAQAGVHALGVDEGAVQAVDNSAVIFPRNAARAAQTADAAGGGAGGDDAAGLVAADKPAHGAQGADLAAEGAVGEKAAVYARKPAHDAVVAGGDDRAAHVQVVHVRVLPRLEEEAAGGLGGAECEIEDGVATAVKLAVEDGDGRKVHAGQGQVIFQHDLFPAGPGVEGAFPRKHKQILRRADADGLRLLGEGGRAQGEDQRCQKQQQDTDRYALIHSPLPPLRPLRRVPRERFPPAPASAAAPGNRPRRRFLRQGPLSSPTAAARSRRRRWCRGKRR